MDDLRSRIEELKSKARASKQRVEVKPSSPPPAQDIPMQQAYEPIEPIRPVPGPQVTNIIEPKEEPKPSMELPVVQSDQDDYEDPEEPVEVEDETPVVEVPLEQAARAWVAPGWDVQPEKPREVEPDPVIRQVGKKSRLNPKIPLVAGLVIAACGIAGMTIFSERPQQGEGIVAATIEAPKAETLLPAPPAVQQPMSSVPAVMAPMSSAAISVPPIKEAPVVKPDEKKEAKKETKKEVKRRAAQKTEPVKPKTAKADSVKKTTIAIKPEVVWEVVDLVGVGQVKTRNDGNETIIKVDAKKAGVAAKVIGAAAKENCGPDAVCFRIGNSQVSVQ